jgi:hypothetical protein
MSYPRITSNRMTAFSTTLLCSCFLSANATGGPQKSEAASNKVQYIGLLKKREEAAGSVFTHAFYFKYEAGKFSDLSVPEPHTVPPAADWSLSEAPILKIFATFDGKSIGDLILQKTWQVVDLSKSGQIILKINWMIQHHRPRRLITTSNARFSDPDGWHAVPLASSGIKESEIRDQFDKQSVCKPEQKEDKLKVDRLYMSKDRLKVLVGVPVDCGQVENFGSTWLFKSAQGWKRVEQTELVDIGDFAGSGKSQALFYGYDPPYGYVKLFSLDSFAALATASDNGY